MIKVTRFNGTEFYVNVDLIVTVESTPDTVITLNNNVKLVVKEKASVVIERIIRYHRLVHNPDLDIYVGE